MTVEEVTFVNMVMHFLNSEVYAVLNLKLRNGDLYTFDVRKSNDIPGSSRTFSVFADQLRDAVQTGILPESTRKELENEFRKSRLVY